MNKNRKVSLTNIFIIPFVEYLFENKKGADALMLKKKIKLLVVETELHGGCFLITSY